jgi:hypothetical protein
MDDPDSIANCFASHFERIYNPTDNNFDSDFFHNIENEYSSITKSTTLQYDSIIPGGEITPTEVSSIIKDLKRRKAPGIDCIQNEHLIHGGSSLSKCISHLFNSIIHLGKIPTIWKKDIIVHIHKGNNEPKKSPDSYRPIALLPCFMKLFEKILIQRTRLHILPSTQFPNPQQQGFQPSLGSITASFIFQETIFHNIEHGSSVYVAFLDTQKAFDTVWRHGLMFKLRHLGVTGCLWTLIDDGHSNTPDQFRLVSRFSRRKTRRSSVNFSLSSLHQRSSPGTSEQMYKYRNLQHKNV